MLDKIGLTILGVEVAILCGFHLCESICELVRRIE